MTILSQKTLRVARQDATACPQTISLEAGAKLELVCSIFLDGAL
jgi:hypothetical protein